MDKAILDKYELVVGLEVHAQLLTESKAYAADSAEFGQMPNTNISVITLAHPGTLPRINKKVVEYAMKMGLACHCDITEYNIYDRKNYFYPDLPKGYQVTQDKTPICRGGYVDIKTKDGEGKRITLTRIHMEEDAGKSMHLDGESETFVDLNRAGVPLIEIVTDPVIRTSEEAYAYLTEVRKLVRYLDICDGNMEEGSLRCDANISVRLKGAEKFGNRVEVKNMNSIRNVQRAIEHEMERQIEVLENGGAIFVETRTFNAATGTTASMRAKENLNDYRYFPEPDLPPLVISREWVADVQSQMPALPQELYVRFTQEYGLSDYDAQVLTDSKQIALYYLQIIEHTANYKAAANWLMGPIKSVLNDRALQIEQFSLSPAQVAEFIALVDANKISFAIASQRLFPAYLDAPTGSVEAMAQQMNLIQDSGEDFIRPLVVEALSKFPDKVEAYKAGNKNLLGLFMGEVMKLGKGKVDPKRANELIREVLGC